MGNTKVGDLVEIWSNTFAPAGLGIVVGHEVEKSILGDKKYARVSWVDAGEPWGTNVTRFKEHLLKVIS